MPRLREIRIIPAYAGSTPGPLSRLLRTPDHPRIRGEHASWAAEMLLAVGSSPHTRGALCRPESATECVRIIPAYAGSTDSLWTPGACAWDHPRIRGEHFRQRILVRAGHGSSPHTRGARYREIGFETIDRIIPAYAGSTVRRRRPLKSPCGSSPHTRGAQINKKYGLDISVDHPRIRGEHILAMGSFSHSTGSSPHTRGAHHSRGAASAAPRIIPAYAGSTPKESTHDCR